MPKLGSFAGVACIALVAAIVLGSVPHAGAYKWRECPAPPVPVHPSVLGATNAPFAHPGHELSILLNEAEVAASGGFSTAAGGNEISIQFVSLFGDPIALPTRAQAAVSPAVLTFDFPDAVAEVGRTLAGPVQIRVSRAGRRVAEIAAKDFIGLPAAVDVTPLILGEDSEGIVHAALGADGDLWIPSYFSGEPMGGMPGCDGDDFIVPVALEIGGAVVVGTVEFPFDPTTRVRKVRGYLGDMVINGTDFYGFAYPEPIRLEQIGGTLGVSICRLNDADDLVLRFHGDSGWARPSSPFRLVARDSAALALRLRRAPGVPRSDVAAARAADRAAPGRQDSFGHQCTQH